MARFDFTLGSKTEDLFQLGIEGRFIDRLSKSRLFDEFKKGLNEREPASVLSILRERGLIEQVCPGALLDESTLEEISSLKDSSDRWMAVFGALTRSSTDEHFFQTLERFEVPKLLSEKLYSFRAGTRTCT